ncbi:MAG TPA: LysR substrate-binding domain-containing protein [Stellaceae bacterium]|nr:LysR substrate-binding domain-containing protein [Stellaceae bacterium]
MMTSPERMNYFHRMSNLPPFAPLIAFDAVARHLSFTRTANELGLTQSAVSHRVKRLERHFGMPLLQRLNPGLALTAGGAAVAARLSELFDAMARLDGLAKASKAVSALRSGASASVSGWWLARRVSEFVKKNPDVTVALLPLENDEAARTRDIDLTLLWVGREEARASSTQIPLFREQVFPVASPHLVVTTPIDPAALADLPLIHKEERQTVGRRHDAGPEWRWSTWFEQWRLPRRTSSRPRDLHCGDIGTALSAAVAGIGVALGRSLLVHDAIAEGRLKPVLTDNQRLPSSKVHVLRWSPALIGDPRRARLVSWLRKAAIASSTDDANAGPR